MSTWLCSHSASKNTLSQGTATRSNITTAVAWPYRREKSAAPCSTFSPGRPAGREMIVTPGASTGTAQQTAKSASARPMLRLGMTRNSCM